MIKDMKKEGTGCVMLGSEGLAKSKLAIIATGPGRRNERAALCDEASACRVRAGPAASPEHGRWAAML